MGKALLIKKVKIVPGLEGKTEFERDKNQVQLIILDDENVIKIKFENNENHIKSIEIPTDGLIKTEFEKSSKWDVKFVSIHGVGEIYYEKLKVSEIRKYP